MCSGSNNDLTPEIKQHQQGHLGPAWIGLFELIH